MRKFSSAVLLAAMCVASLPVLSGCGCTGESALQIRNPLAVAHLAPQAAIPPENQVVVQQTAVEAPALRAQLVAPTAFAAAPVSACPVPVNPQPVVGPEPLFGVKRQQLSK